MRLHEHFPVLWPTYDAGFVREMLHVEHLVAVRLEPVYSQRFEAFMDALFERNGNWLVVPMMRIEGVAIMVPENPCVTWPASYERFAGEQTEAIDAQIAPWLRSLTAGRLVNDEHVRFFRETPETLDAYERAREEGLIGASPYPRVLQSVGGAAYALRFAHGKSIALRGADAANGAAMFSSVSSEIDAELSEFSRRWFAGVSIGNLRSDKTYGCYVGPRDGAVAAVYAVFDGEAREGERAVSLAEPIPTDVSISFDLEDGPENRRYGVTERRVETARFPVVAPAAVGGSAGQIAIVVRDDAARFGDADGDAAHALAERLGAEGFRVSVSPAAQVDRRNTDLIHVFGLRHTASLVELLRDAETARIPVVVTPFADDRRGEAVSGASGSLLIPRVSSDTVVFYDYVTAFAGRKVANLTEAPWYDKGSAVLLARAAQVIVAGPSEAEFLRQRFGYAGPTVPGRPLVPLVQPEPEIGALVGPDPYVLIHAPLESRCNQVYAVLAAQRLKIPLVLMGPVADIEFFRYINECSGPMTMALRDHELTPEEISGVYARAKVVADIAWSSRGLERLARGACYGAVPVASNIGYAGELFGDLAILVDPASLDSITDGFDRAWNAAPAQGARLISRATELSDPSAALVACVSAYQQASAAAVT